jgi:hypothetical protein
MKILFAILLCALPVAWDLIIGRVFWRKKTVVNHPATTAVRLLIMLALAYFNPTVEVWRSLALTVTFHFLVFPILYNRLILNQAWYFIGTSALSDRIELRIRGTISTEGVYFFKFLFLLISVTYYVTTCVQWWCFN